MCNFNVINKIFKLKKECDMDYDGMLSKNNIKEMLYKFSEDKCDEIEFKKCVKEFWLSSIIPQILNNPSSTWKNQNQIPDQEIERIENIGLQVNNI